MKKLIQGILDFRRNLRPSYKEMFARLALGQRPDALFIACSDSRVVPNLFASSDPGDLFVVRNVGNFIPSYTGQQGSADGASESAAIEFALLNLPVTEIIVCGHSECGAMNALLSVPIQNEARNLNAWLKHGEGSVRRLIEGGQISPHLERHNRLSQLNVLEQLDHLRTYPAIRERVTAGRLRLHGWWFDIREAEVHEYRASDRCFRLIDESSLESC